jgi:hypothetical protein
MESDLSDCLEIVGVNVRHRRQSIVKWPNVGVGMSLPPRKIPVQPRIEIKSNFFSFYQKAKKVHTFESFQ